MAKNIDWKDATLETINRLRNVRNRNPQITYKQWTWILSQARMLTESMKVDAQKYWSVYVNCARILAAFMESEPPESEVFDSEPTNLPLLEESPARPMSLRR